jgi:hypothetical protein
MSGSRLSRSRSPYEPRAGEHITPGENKDKNKNLTTPKNPFAMNRSEVAVEKKNIRLEEKASRIGQRVAQLLLEEHLLFVDQDA